MYFLPQRYCIGLHFRLLVAALILLCLACRSKETDTSSQDELPDRDREIPFYFNDSNIITDNTVAIGDLGRARKYTGIDMVMVIKKEIPKHYTIENYASALFDYWRIGERHNGKGVLILLVEDLGEVKIEVGYELEDVFTDGFCGSYQEIIKYHFAGRFLGDVISGLILNMMKKYNGDAVTLEDISANLQKVEFYTGEREFLSGGAGVTERGFVYDKKMKLAKIVDNTPEELICGYRSSQAVKDVVDRYQESLDKGVNYPYLDFLTEGSQLMRIEYPSPPSFYEKQGREFRNAMPYKIYQQGNLAAVRFNSKKLQPLFLLRTPDGFWKLDITKSWAFSQMNDSMTEMYQLYKDHPWIFAFPEYTPKKSRVNIPELIPFPQNIEGRIESLKTAIEKAPNNPLDYFKLADILYWECYWIGDAITTVEQGLRLEPENVPYRWLAIDMCYRYPRPREVPKHYEKLIELNPYDFDVYEYYIGHCETFSRDKMKIKELVRKYEKARKAFARKKGAP